MYEFHEHSPEYLEGSLLADQKTSFALFLLVFVLARANDVFIITPQSVEDTPMDALGWSGSNNQAACLTGGGIDSIELDDA